MKVYKDHYIRARVTEHEYNHIKLKSQNMGLPLSAYIRNIAMNYPVKSVADQNALNALLSTRADLGRVGGLLKLALSQKTPLGDISTVEVEQLLHDIEDKAQKLLLISEQLL
jgi:hypothetical protein